jgi:inorganic triphosphatase YgiF
MPEIELKLALDRAAVRRAADLARHPAVMAVRRGRARTSRVTSTYFDTPDFALEHAGIALRVRRDGARWLQTVKGPPLASEGGALHAHDEHEWPLARPSLDPARFAQTPWHRVFSKVQKQGKLSPLFATDIVRRTLALEFAEGTTATLAIDVGAIRTKRPPGRRASIAEIEIEIADGNPEPAYRLALALLDDWPLSIATATKASRGYALVRGDPEGGKAPIRAEAVEFAPDAPADEALRAVAQGCLRHIGANATGLVTSADPEWVHQMRIGTRRLRSCLALLESIYGKSRVAPLVKEVRWLAAILGEARDWDVLAEETLSPLAGALAQDPVARKDLARLRRSIGGHRSAARKAARDAVRSARFQRMMLSIGAFCAERGDPQAHPIESAQKFAARLLTHRHARLLDRGAALESGTPEERHAVRIAAKKLRYAAEFFSPPDPRKRNRAYLKALSRLQDALGHAQDAQTAIRLAAGLARKSDDATVGAVRGWAAAQTAAQKPEIARSWERFLAAKPFWARE